MCGIQEPQQIPVPSLVETLPGHASLTAMSLRRHAGDETVAQAHSNTTRKAAIRPEVTASGFRFLP